MTTPAQLEHRFREVILNGRWIANTNFKEQLSNTSWEMAVASVGDLNSIAKLTYHIHYYIAGLIKVLEGGPLDIKDRYSFDLPPVQSQEDWEKLLTRFWDDAEKFAVLISNMPAHRLEEAFVNEKYGSWQRNIDALIEHSYYHLGQVVMIKKLLM